MQGASRALGGGLAAVGFPSFEKASSTFADSVAVWLAVRSMEGEDLWQAVVSRGSAGKRTGRCWACEKMNPAVPAALVSGSAGVEREQRVSEELGCRRWGRINARPLLGGVAVGRSIVGHGAGPVVTSVGRFSAVVERPPQEEH